MKHELLNIHVRLLVNIYIISLSHGTTIQLYKHQNFTGLQWNGSSTLECANIKTSLHTKVHSIRTSTCFIAYEHPHCNSRWTMKFVPGNIKLSKNQIARVSSLHSCNKEEGGNHLNVDITKYYAWDTFGHPGVIQSFKDVCTCINIPEFVQNMGKWSINNHHNALLAYYEPNCSENKWNSKFISAGHSYSSKYMHYHKKEDPVTKQAHKIQSFGPDPNSAYFLSNCNSSKVTTVHWNLVNHKNPNSHNNTKRFLTDKNSNVLRKIQVLISNVVELRTKFDQSTHFQLKYKSDIQSLFCKHNTNLDKFTEQITRFQKKFVIQLTKNNLTCFKCLCDYDK